jgi:hypothetical protein
VHIILSRLDGINGNFNRVVQVLLDEAVTRCSLYLILLAGNICFDSGAEHSARP